MPWIGAIGATVIGAFGGAVAAGSLTAMVVGGAIIGAAAGALYTAFKGGNLLKNMLFGAIGGAVVGGIGYALAPAAGAAGGAGGGGGVATSVGASENVAAAAASQGGSIVGGSAGGQVAGNAAVASWFTKDTVQAAGGLSSLGAAFLNGGSDDRDADRALEEKKFYDKLKADQESLDKSLKAQMSQAELAAATSRKNSMDQKEVAMENLSFSKDKFAKEFDEAKRRYDTDRNDVLTAKQRFQESVETSGNYAAGQARSISLVESNRRRRELPAPVWSTGKPVEVASNTPPPPEQQTATPQQTGLLAGATA